MSTRLFSFMGGAAGRWRVVAMKAIAGEALPGASRLEIASGPEIPSGPRAAWVLRGITSNERYVVGEERSEMVARQLSLGRPEATCGAFIPIRKNAAWWALTQEQRQHVFEKQSHHARIGLQYFPTLARRLHHCRDLSEREPFDFLTWFEYAPADEAAFNALLAGLRATEEWGYVEREVDVRLVRE
ncbi:MAG: chlorite dismutase [Chromatiales bacterium 21-64-14]|nr:MAG: chlorite dismutase [Chromatiales bacterium 21-64-14]HQU17338.1 chlorite dismutase family protein [Gammaproteobacteria bacterium]